MSKFKFFIHKYIIALKIWFRSNLWLVVVVVVVVASVHKYCN